jgi:Folylpolyglutamate synthase
LWLPPKAAKKMKKLTYFEFITALALIAFARAQVELAILEAGLGGKYDATSAVPADLLLITPISLDHQNVLGQELLEIAANKAGAMKPGQIIITSEQEPDVLALLKAKANALGNSLFKPVRPGSTPDENNEPKQRPQDKNPEPGDKSTRSSCSPRSPRPPCSASHANKTLALGMMGMQQADNSRLALAGLVI